MRGMILRGMGLKAGVPDVLIVHEGRAHWVELKAPRGVLSEAQRSTLALIAAAGCPWVVCRSLDELRGALHGWGIPTREAPPTPVDALRRSMAAQDRDRHT